MPMFDLIQIRRDTSANWASVNPILASGELGKETDSSVIKCGDGITEWNLLPSIVADSGDMNGPEASTDSAIALYDGTTGKLLKNSTVLIDSSGNMSEVSSIDVLFDTVVHGSIQIGDTSSYGTLVLNRPNTGSSYSTVVFRSFDGTSNNDRVGIVVEGDETGSDSGSDFNLYMFDDTGGAEIPLYITRDKLIPIGLNRSTRISGDLIVGNNNEVDRFVYITGDSSYERGLIVQSNGINRWGIHTYYGYFEDESGDNSGSILAILSYDDSGSLLDAPIIFQRNQTQPIIMGRDVQINEDLNVNGGIDVGGGYGSSGLSINSSGNISSNGNITIDGTFSGEWISIDNNAVINNDLSVYNNIFMGQVTGLNQIILYLNGRISSGFGPSIIYTTNGDGTGGYVPISPNDVLFSISGSCIDSTTPTFLTSSSISVIAESLTDNHWEIVPSNGITKLVVDNSGVTSYGDFTVLSDLVSFQSDGLIDLVLKSYNSSASHCTLNFISYRGTSSSPQKLVGGDLIGAINFYGADTTTGSVSYGSSIQSLVDTTGVSSGIVPSNLKFYTKDISGNNINVLTMDNTGLSTFTRNAKFTGSNTIIQLGADTPSGYTILNIAADNTSSSQLRFYNGAVTAYAGLRWISGSDTSANAYQFFIDRYDGSSYQDRPFIISNSNGASYFEPGLVTVGKNTGASSTLLINSAANTYRDIYFQSAGSNRISLEIANTTESGSNTGGNFQINTYNDAGSYLGTPFYIERSTGNITMNAVTASTVSATSQLDVGGGYGSTGCTISSTGSITTDSYLATNGDIYCGNNIGNARIFITSTTSTSSHIRFYNGSTTSNAGLRWILQSDGSPYNFNVYRYIDGTYQDTPISFSNSTGIATFSATPVAPTAATGTNTTALATTAFVTAASSYGTYYTLLNVGASHTAAKVAGTYALGYGGVAAVSGTGTLYPLGIIGIYSADFPTVNGKSPKLRIRAQVNCNDVAPTGNFTFGLYPITRPGTSGGAGLCTYTIGTVVSGSNGATVSTPAADSQNSLVGSDFALPSDGQYIIAVVTTATVATSAHVHLNAQLQVHYA